MKNSQISKLTDLIGDIKKVDAMIALHNKNGDSVFMSEQYESKKAKLMSQIIDELNAPSVQSIQSLYLIHQILTKVFPESNQLSGYDEDIEKLVAVIA